MWSEVSSGRRPSEATRIIKSYCLIVKYRAIYVDIIILLVYNDARVSVIDPFSGTN